MGGRSKSAAEELSVDAASLKTQTGKMNTGTIVPSLNTSDEIMTTLRLLQSRLSSHDLKKLLTHWQ